MGPPVKLRLHSCASRNSASKAGSCTLQAVAKKCPSRIGRGKRSSIKLGYPVTPAFPMQRRPPWLLIGALVALILLPGPTLRLLFGVARGLSLLFLLLPLLAGVAGLAAWLWWRRLQAQVKQCPACGIPTMNTSSCPACGYSFAGSTQGSGGKNDPIDVQAEILDD